MNMYVGNLSYNVKEVDLREVMEEYGTVGSVKLIIDRDTRRSKGFAFVEMPETSEASNAIKQSKLDRQRKRIFLHGKSFFFVYQVLMNTTS